MLLHKYWLTRFKVILLKTKLQNKFPNSYTFNQKIFSYETNGVFIYPLAMYIITC